MKKTLREVVETSGGLCVTPRPGLIVLIDRRVALHFYRKNGRLKSRFVTLQGKPLEIDQLGINDNGGLLECVEL